LDNTKIYLDNNNDGVWDYAYSGNAGEVITLNPVIERAKFGGRIHADKPINYYQQGYSNQYYGFWFVIPPINSWRKEYYITSPGTSYTGVNSWYVLTDKKITLYAQTGNATTNYTINPAEKKEIPYGAYTRVYSNESFALVSPSGVAPISGNNFYTPFNSLKIIVPESGTYIEIDNNNDGFYDNKTIYNKGVIDLSVLEGAHIRSTNNLAIFANLNSFLGAILPTTSIGSDFYATGGYILGIFSEFTGLLNRTTIEVYPQKTSLLNLTSFVYANRRYNYPISGYLHISTNMPTLPVYYADGGSWSKSLQTHAYSQIYLTTYSSKKYISNNEPNTFVVRIFNPFAKDNATNFNLAINYPANFTALSNVVIERKSLLNDAVLESSSANYDLVDYGFTMNPTVNTMLNYLGPLQYFEIRYDLTTPDTLGKFTFPSARMTYDAQTWIIS